MGFATIVKIAFGSVAVADALQTPKPHEPAALGNHPEPPRMLVMRGCDGSKAIMSTAQALMVNHGIPIAVGSEVLNPEKNQFLERTDSNLRQAIELANDEARKSNKTLMFKTATGGNFKSVWPRVKESLKSMGTLSVIGSKKNMLDEVICRARNCQDESYGYPANNDGKNFSEKACFDRDPSEKRRFQVHLDAKKLFQSIDKEAKLAEDAQRQLHMSGFAYAEVQSEKLLGYTSTNSEDDFDIAVREWSIFLRGWGVHPDEKIISNRLKKDQGSRQSLTHKDALHNFKEIHDILKAAKPEYQHLLNDCESHSNCDKAEAAEESTEDSE